MNHITFDFVVPPSIVESDKKKDIQNYSAEELRYFSEGKIFIFFYKIRNFIVIESEVLDYLIQIKKAINFIEAGNDRVLTISGDYYSNSLSFDYLKTTKTLTIRERNKGEFNIEIAFKKFKDAFLKFYRDALGDLELLYPKLKYNSEFKKLYEEI